MPGKFVNALLVLPFLWAMTGLFWHPKGASYMGLFCIVSAVVAGVKLKMVLLSNVKNNPFLWILGATFIYAVVMYFYHGYSSRELKALFFSALFLFFFPINKLSSRLFFGFVFAGVFGASIMAAYQYAYLDISRVHGFINPITYAVFSGLCLASLFPLFLLETNKLRKINFLILNVLLLLVIVSTGTRGVLLGVVLTLFIMVGMYMVLLKRKSLVGFLFFLTCISGMIYFHPAFQSRVEQTWKEVRLIKEGNYSSSIGLRVQVWSSAYYSALKKPFLGLGDAYAKEFEEQGKKGLISKQLYERRFSHYHNQFIDRYMKTGLIGLLLLLLILGYPLYEALKTPSFIFPKIAIIGIVALIAISGLTDVPLNHAPIIYCYFFIMSYLLHLLKNPEKSDEVSGM